MRLSHSLQETVSLFQNLPLEFTPGKCRILPISGNENFLYFKTSYIIEKLTFIKNCQGEVEFLAYADGSGQEFVARKRKNPFK